MSTPQRANSARRVVHTYTYTSSIPGPMNKSNTIAETDLELNDGRLFVSMIGFNVLFCSYVRLENDLHSSHNQASTTAFSCD